MKRNRKRIVITDRRIIFDSEWELHEMHISRIKEDIEGEKYIKDKEIINYRIDKSDTKEEK